MGQSLRFNSLFSLYVFSLHVCGEQQIDLITKKLEFHNHDTRSAKNFHPPNNNLTKYQKESYYTGVKILHYFATHMKKAANEIRDYKKTLQGFLLDESFYSIDEYFNANSYI